VERQHDLVGCEGYIHSAREILITNQSRLQYRLQSGKSCTYYILYTTVT
jgi:hypothetical protein